MPRISPRPESKLALLLAGSEDKDAVERALEALSEEERWILLTMDDRVGPAYRTAFTKYLRALQD